MIPIGTAGQVIAAYLLVLVLGALGGLAASLLLHGAAGRLELPRRGVWTGERQGEKYWDLGFWSEVIVGVVAACAVLWFIGPDTAIDDGGNVPAYSAPVLIGASLVAGTAGGAILAALANRARDLAEGQRGILERDTALLGMKMAVSVTEVQARKHGDDGDRTIPVETIQAIIDQVAPRQPLPAVAGGPADPSAVAAPEAAESSTATSEQAPAASGLPALPVPPVSPAQPEAATVLETAPVEFAGGAPAATVEVLETATGEPAVVNGTEKPGVGTATGEPAAASGDGGGDSGGGAGDDGKSTANSAR